MRGKHVGLSLVVLLACVSVQAGEIDLGACRAIEKISKQVTYDTRAMLPVYGSWWIEQQRERVDAIFDQAIDNDPRTVLRPAARDVLWDDLQWQCFLELPLLAADITGPKMAEIKAFGLYCDALCNELKRLDGLN